MQVASQVGMHLQNPHTLVANIHPSVLGLLPSSVFLPHSLLHT